MEVSLAVRVWPFATKSKLTFLKISVVDGLGEQFIEVVLVTVTDVLMEVVLLYGLLWVV